MLLEGLPFLLLFLCSDGERRTKSSPQDGLNPSSANFWELVCQGRGIFILHDNSLALPLTSQLSEEDEKVTKCITEILADTLSRPSPIPVTGECMKILREDERVLAMLHHQHLLNELEELTHQENVKHRLGHEGGHDAWEVEADEQEDVRKRDKKQTLEREAGSEQMREQNGGRKEEEQEMKEYEKTEKNEEKVKEEEVSEGEDRHKALEEQVKELMEEEDKEEKAEEEEDEARKKKRRSSSETWSSKEYFGHIKKRGPGQPKIREVMLEESQDDRKRSGWIKRRFKMEEEEEDDSSEEEPKRYRHRGFNEGRHYEDWQDEEEDAEVKKRPSLAKRVAEKASDEETAQFEEEEEKGLKLSNSQIHLHGGWQPWQKEEQEGERRHGRPHKRAGLDLKKRHEKDAIYPKGRHHGHDGEEDDAREASPDEELQKLEEIEQELKRAAEKLEALKRG